MKTFFALTSIALMLILTPFAQAQIDGLILYMSFDEGVGDVAADLSGFGNHGEIIGATWVDGADSGALEFNGADTYVEVPYDEMFNLNEAFTLAAWVKPAQSPFAAEQWRGIINGQMTNHGPYLLQMSGANPEIGAWLGGTWEFQLGTTALDTDNFWHLVGTYDVDEGFRVYVNGELDSEGGAGGVDVIDNVDEGVVIGHNYNFAGRWFEGIIDEAAIFNRALDEDEVMELYEGLVKQEVAAVNPIDRLTTTWGELKK